MITKHFKDEEIDNEKGWLLVKLIELVSSDTRNNHFDLRGKKCFTKEINFP